MSVGADITTAYYGLTRKYHPDADGDDSASLSKFKQINEAYEVLSHECKRRDYDRRTNRRGRPTSTAEFDDAPFHEQTKAAQTPAPTVFMMPDEVVDIEVELPIRPEEARYGGPCEFTVTVPVKCMYCDGCGRSAGVLCRGCGGTGEIRQRRHLKIILPRGLRTGSIIRMAGFGSRSLLAAGDLLVKSSFYLTGNARSSD